MTSRGRKPTPTTEEEIHQALMVIDSRIVTLDGKVTLVARANRDTLLPALEEVVKTNPIIGQIYLLLDGTKNQEDLTAALKKKGIQTSKSAVSRWLGVMSSEHGIADQVTRKGPGKTYRKNPQMDDALNLTPKVEKWLAEIAKERRAKKGRTR
jgi:hypothetical protein